MPVPTYESISSLPLCHSNLRVFPGQHGVAMRCLFCECLTSRSIYLTFLRNIVGETVVRSCGLSLKKKTKTKHVSLKKIANFYKRRHCWNVNPYSSTNPQWETPSISTRTISSLSLDNAGYIALESIKSPWQWQWFLPGHWKQCLEELYHLTQDLGHWKEIPFPAWAAGKQNWLRRSRDVLYLLQGSNSPRKLC